VTYNELLLSDNCNHLKWLILSSNGNVKNPIVKWSKHSEYTPQSIEFRIGVIIVSQTGKVRGILCVIFILNWRSFHSVKPMVRDMVSIFPTTDFEFRSATRMSSPFALLYSRRCHSSRVVSVAEHARAHTRRAG